MMTLAGIIATIVVSFIALWPKRKRNSKPMTPGSKFDLGAGAVNAYRKMTTDKMSQPEREAYVKKILDEQQEWAQKCDEECADLTEDEWDSMCQAEVDGERSNSAPTEREICDMWLLSNEMKQDEEQLYASGMLLPRPPIEVKDKDLPF